MLDAYRTKRRLPQTPEPPATRKPGGEGRRFVVHKHWARRLHYDLRLEHEGVLKSWAIPKGFSLDPRVKRLAVQVEDHPYAYKDFSGRIPAGHYGAGEVIIWDEGTYTPVPRPEQSGSPGQIMRAALAKGHLEVAFHGTKLHGVYTLLQLKGQPRNWLLIKKDDDFASAASVLDEAPVSRRQRTRPHDRLDSAPPLLAGFDLTGARKTRRPSQVDPMLATLVAEPFNADEWSFEVKWDGYRSLAQVAKNRVRLFSRNHQLQNRQFPSIVKGLQGLQVEALLDGEMVVIDDQGRADFQALQQYLQTGQGVVVYYVFDLLWVQGLDIRPLPLRRRQAILAKILPDAPNIRLSVAVHKSGKAFYRAALKNGLEGMVAKNLGSPYRSGKRSPDWLKIKALKQQEAIICGFTRSGASREHFSALILGVYQDQTLVFAGQVGTGFTQDSLASLARRMKPWITPRCPFARAPKIRGDVVWVKPKLVCEIKFAGWTRDGSMRIPVFLGLREDLAPQAATHEQPTHFAPETPEKIGLAAPTRARLTNVEKVFWPQEGYTKKDLILYYEHVAPWLLPYLKNRPESLNRHPEGITQPGFFQKNMASDLPRWVKTILIDSDHRGRPVRYLICQNRDTLLYLANLGCIEINIWDSSLPHLKKPDFLVLDFDPVQPGLSAVITAVLAMKKLLDQIGLPGWVKTSGRRGLHVYIPLQPKFAFEPVRDFASMLTSILAQRHPGLLARERNPGQRQGKVYLDYPQNRYGATMVAPYALRPRPGAPVSTPLAWSEVTPKLDPLAFNLRTLPERLARRGDPWKDFFAERVDLVQALPRVEKLIARSI